MNNINNTNATNATTPTATVSPAQLNNDIAAAGDAAAVYNAADFIRVYRTSFVTLGNAIASAFSSALGIIDQPVEADQTLPIQLWVDIHRNLTRIMQYYLQHPEHRSLPIQFHVGAQQHDGSDSDGSDSDGSDSDGSEPSSINDTDTDSTTSSFYNDRYTLASG